MKKLNVSVLLFAGVILINCSSYEEKKGIDVKNQGATSHAQNHPNPVYYNNSAPFMDGPSVKPEIKSECNINETLVNAIYQYAEERNLPIVSIKDFSDKAGLKDKLLLSVEIVQADSGLNVFGATGSVPATSTAVFRIHKNDELILEEFRNCQTKFAGFMGLAPSACNKLDRCAINQGAFIVNTIKSALYGNKNDFK